MADRSNNPSSRIEVLEESFSILSTYGRISIAFNVENTFEVLQPEDASDVYRLIKQPVTEPWVKDYDAIPGNHPTDWRRKFDASNWGLLSAYMKNTRVGGAVIAWKTDGVYMLEGRDDLAVLWDLRTTPEFRAMGVGKALFAASEQWGRCRGCRQLKIETQNINVSACEFYTSRGCTLGAVNRSA